MSTNNNQQTAQPAELELFVIYSDTESALCLEPMYWSENQGWSDLGDAAVYTAAERAAYQLPASAGGDARWMPYPDALKVGSAIHDQGANLAICSMTFSVLEATALRMCIASFLRAEMSQQGGLGPKYMQYLRPVRSVLLAGHTTVNLSVLQFSLLCEALRREPAGVPSTDLQFDVYKQALDSLRRQFSMRAERLRAKARLNIYTHEFTSKCPNNGYQIQYRLVIETSEMVLVEDIVALATAHPEGFHEDLADVFYKVFGGSQCLTAIHHGVEIKTIRTDDSLP